MGRVPPPPGPPPPPPPGPPPPDHSPSASITPLKRIARFLSPRGFKRSSASPYVETTPLTLSPNDSTYSRAYSNSLYYDSTDNDSVDKSASVFKHVSFASTALSLFQLFNFHLCCNALAF